MIRPRFALKLARTKLYSKPIMTSSSVLVSSILFAALIALTFIFTGAEQGAQEFIKRSGGNRYLVKVSPNIPNEVNGIYDNLSLEEIHEIKDFQKKYYDDLRARYKTLGLVYDEKSEIPALSPASWMSKTIPEEQRVVVNFSSPVITALNNQKLLEYSKNAKNKFSDLRTVGEKYGANGYYLAGNSSRLPQIPALRLIKDGKEDFGDSELKSGDMSTHGYYINAVHNGNYVFYDQRLLERYLIQDNPVLKGIPVVVSAQEVASLLKDELNVSDEPEEYTEKVTWLKDLRSKAQGKTYQVCYRNTTEQTLLEKIQSDYAEIKSNEKKLNYTEPSLQYDYPKQACGDIEIKKIRARHKKES